VAEIFLRRAWATYCVLFLNGYASWPVNVFVDWETYVYADLESVYVGWASGGGAARGIDAVLAASDASEMADEPRDEASIRAPP